MARVVPERIVAGVSLSHPDRVLFPKAGATKRDLARYYETIADWILPHLVDRPLTLVRCPNGVSAAATRTAGPSTGSGSSRATSRDDCFYMKHSKVWTWPAIRRVRIREKTKVGEYMSTVPVRLARLRTDPWRSYWKMRQRIPPRAVRALEAM
jgi:bifunctional non-homologous end joining protein LigD